MGATVTRRAAVYLRISLDSTGEGLAIARQRELCAQIVADRGWQLVGEYVDDSISASDAKKNRPAYNRLVDAYAAGDFDALVCYDLDRLTRQPRQLEDWIDAAQDRGLALVTANGEADLTTDAGRMFARIKAAVARGEVERKSARQRAAAAQRAAIGRPPLGVRLTGYTPKGDVVETEADIVRRIFTLFCAGDSLRSITAYLNESGHQTRHGRPWNPSSVRGILTNPRYAGRAIYQGKPTGELGTWEPLIESATFDMVQARLADPRRATNGEGTDRKHIGAGLYLCGVCDHPVVTFSGGRYRCRAGAHVNRTRSHVDDFVLRTVARRLSRDDAAGMLAEGDAADLAPLFAESDRLRDRLGTIGDDYDAGRIDGLRYSSAVERVRVELDQIERRIAAASGIQSAALGQVLASDDPGATFLELPPMVQREIIGALCIVRLHKGQRGRKGFDPNTVGIIWKGSE